MAKLKKKQPNLDNFLDGTEERFVQEFEDPNERHYKIRPKVIWQGTIPTLWDFRIVKVMYENYKEPLFEIERRSHMPDSMNDPRGWENISFTEIGESAWLLICRDLDKKK